MSKLMTVGVALSAALSLSACATEDYVNTHVATVQTQVDAQNAHLAQLDQTSQDALNRAEAAGKLAEGKFMYSVVLSDDSMKFPISSSELSSEAQTRLMDFVQKLKADNKNVYLEIQGYTDNTGSSAENLRLGEERAEAVRRFMSLQGVPLNRMSTISYGNEQPVAPNTTRAGRAQNRRVVLVVLA
jgi:outer membrane protein OmpA-like peptidoglycan-associated protein